MGTSIKKADVISSVMIVGFILLIGLTGCSKHSNESQVSVPQGKAGYVTNKERVRFADQFSAKRMGSRSNIAFWMGD